MVWWLVWCCCGCGGRCCWRCFFPIHLWLHSFRHLECRFLLSLFCPTCDFLLKGIAATSPGNSGSFLSPRVLAVVPGTHAPSVFLRFSFLARQASVTCASDSESLSSRCSSSGEVSNSAGSSSSEKSSCNATAMCSNHWCSVHGAVFLFFGLVVL